MKKFLLLISGFISLSVIQAQIINIPADYPTIQMGINAANEGDTVLVQPGVYNEYLDFNGKEITVTSLFLTTLDTSYISQTVITGNSSEDKVIVFENDETPQAQLIGFRITNGMANAGYAIYCDYASPTLKYLKIDGTLNPSNYFQGIYCNHSESLIDDIQIVSVKCVWAVDLRESNMVISNFIISNNSHLDDGYGIFCRYTSLILEDGLITHNPGGISCEYSDVRFHGITITNNNGAGIICYDSNIEFDSVNRCNIYGNIDFYDPCERQINSNSHIDLILDTFSVIHPTGYYLYPVENFTYDILHGLQEQLEADVYISPQGDDKNSGLTPGEPFRTIRHASRVLISDSLHPRTIHLLDGTYSKATNDEIFPVALFDHISLKGSSPVDVILNGEDSSVYKHIISLTAGKNNSVSGITVTNGHGIYCSKSVFEMENITVTNNSQTLFLGGAGVLIENSTGILKKILFENNRSWLGGAICADYSDLIMDNLIITGNYAEGGGMGGGIYLHDSKAKIENSTISLNIADREGGGVYLDNSDASFFATSIDHNRSSDTVYHSYTVGGGVSCYDSNPVFQSCLFTGNSAITGTVLYIAAGSHPQFINCTLTENEQSGPGFFEKYLVWGDNSPGNIITFYNSIIYANDSCDNSMLGGVVATYSDIQTNGHVWPGEGNINEDPLFLNSGDHPYQLSTGSPCIDAGTPDTTDLALPMWDLMGNYRLWDGDMDGDTIVDMGAYEFGSVGVGTEFNLQPSTFNISCYPNPFSEIVHFEYEIVNPSPVSIRVFNVVGELVAVLSDGILAEGQHQIIWNTANLPAGLYFCRVQSGQKMEAFKIVKQ